jgi:hypothetical protein
MRPLRLGADDAPQLQEVACTACATRVLVRKNSLTQTTVQWQDDTESCLELAARRAAGEHTARVAHCEALRTSIDEAVAAGTVTVVE